MAVHLTDRLVDALKPADKPYLTFDDEVSGFAVKTYETGRKLFVFDYRDDAGKQRRPKIGARPVWSTAKARTEASRMRLKVDTGEVVATARGGRAAVLLTQWRDVVAATRRPGTVKAYFRLIDAYILPSFGKSDPKAISHNVVVLWHGELARRVSGTEANRALATLSAFLSWLKRDRKIDHHPVPGVKRHAETQRQTYLNADEIGRAHALLAGNNSRAPALALRLALLTGSRIGEVLSLESSQLDAAHRMWIKPAASTKQKKLHVLPMQPEAFDIAQELLEIGVPKYGAVRGVWDQTKAMLGRPDVRIHDLRHSRASALIRGGGSLPMVGKVLGHTDPKTTSRYGHLVAADLVDLIARS